MICPEGLAELLELGPTEAEQVIEVKFTVALVGLQDRFVRLGYPRWVHW
jgi:hypothetical protein